MFYHSHYVLKVNKEKKIYLSFEMLCLIHTKSQLETAVSINYSKIQNVENASILGRLLLKFRKISQKVGEICNFAPNISNSAVCIQGRFVFQFAMTWEYCGYYSRAVSILGWFLIETLRYIWRFNIMK